MIEEKQHLFVLTPPYCGSTLLWQILKSSPHVTALPKEGQQVVEKEFMPGTKCLENPERQIQWREIKERWEQEWDFEAPIRLDKSPAAIHHAQDLAEWFPPAKFIGLIRDPYAFCEGCFRRKSNYTYGDCAELWRKCAASQKRNIQSLEEIVWFTYESFTERTDEVLQQILEFLPALESLHTEETDTFTVQGRMQEIRNVNPQKIRMLSRNEVEEINEVLKGCTDLLQFFGYPMRDPSDHSQFQAFTARFASRTARMLGWISRKYG